MKNREKEINETANACIIIQNQMNDCENAKELISMYEAWFEMVTDRYMHRLRELNMELKNDKVPEEQLIKEPPKEEKQKIEKLDDISFAKINSNYARLSEKINQLIDAVNEMRGV